MCDLSKETIENIPNYMAGLDILMELNLTNDYVHNVDDIKEMLMQKYHSKPEEQEMFIKGNTVFSSYLKMMNKLKLQLINVKNLIDSDGFQKEFGDLYRISEERIKEKMNRLKEMIDRKKFPILTAGEAKAGKSTFINLFLGCDLMPTATTNCTKIICEVRNSDEKRVTFIVDENDKSLNNVISIRPESMEEITKLIEQKDSKIYQKAVFEYPVDFLDKFTYLVDSPGIGDTETLEGVVIDFLNENSPALIFVLNARNCRGLNLKAKMLISKARVELNKEYNSFQRGGLINRDGQNYTIQMDKAIFVINQWDLIKGDVECKSLLEHIRKSIVKDIKSLWDDSVNVETQIFFFSARQTQEWMKKGVVHSEFIKLRKSVINLMTKIYERNFHNCLCTLHYILDYVERVILRKINSHVDSKYSRFHNKQNTERLCTILENIRKSSEQRMTDIKMKLLPHIDEMIRSLTSHLKTDEFKAKILSSFRESIDQHKVSSSSAKICNSHLSKKDKNQDNESHYLNDKKFEHENVDIATNILKKILEKQMFEELKNWENNYKAIENLKDHLNNLFREQLTQIGSEINLENVFINHSTLIGAWNTLDQSPVKQSKGGIISKVEQVFIISTITLLFPVVAMASVLASPLIITYFFESKKLSSARQEQYEINKDEYLRNVIENSIKDISEDYVRHQFFTEISEQCMCHINSFVSFIQLELDEKQQLIKYIELENRLFPEILHCLNDLLRQIKNCYGDYHLLKNKYLPDTSLFRRSSIYVSDNEAKVNMDKIISLCQNSMVFKSNKNSTVIFKMYSKEFTRHFARFQMQEVEILSTGPFQYISQLKHMCYLEKEEKLLLVLDYADCNLHTFLMENQNLIPLNHNRDTPKWKTAFSFMVDVSKKLCTCLEVIHNFDLRMVHPDFRIDTVLVRKGENPDSIDLFICDVCSNLPTQRIQQRSGSVPDEVAELCFDMGGYTLENIYRLGIIFYEMAYFNGTRRVTSQSIVSMEDEIELIESLQKSLESIDSDIVINWSNDQHLLIPEEYNNLIRRCISKQPQDRPSAKECFDFLSKIKI